ncbi:MAG: RNA polymerase sigma factor [Solirubrobacteraceae bacterium]
MAEPRSADGGAARESLLARSVDDPAAFGAFYECYVQRVSVYFMRRVLDPEIAFDLTAETFALALERRRQFRGHSEHEEQGWLFAIARSLLHAYWRKGRIERAAVARLGIERPSLGTEDIEYLHRQAGIESLRERLAQALDAVRPDQAAAIRARVLEERGYAEIAADFDTTPDVIRARVSRGLRTMQAFLGNKVEDGLADA